jgi:hypothetical protein
VAAGAIFWLAIARVAPIRWFAGLRPSARALGWLAVPAAIGWVPALLGAGLLYGWVADPHRPHAVTSREAWLSVPWFAVRTGAVLALLAGLAATARTRASGRWALAALLVFGPAWTLWAFDAWMSLDPALKSSVYPLTAFAASLRDGLAALILVAALSEEELPADVWHALGRLLLTTLLLWAYLQFSQLLIVWIGGVPLEIEWYLTRWHGVARGASLALFDFTAALVVPLLSRPWKRSRAVMTALAVGTLALGAIESGWDVLPNAGEPVSPWPVLAAAATWIGIAGAVARRRRGPDEDLAKTLAYRSP